MRPPESETQSHRELHLLQRLHRPALWRNSNSEGTRILSSCLREKGFRPRLFIPVPERKFPKPLVLKIRGGAHPPNPNWENLNGSKATYPMKGSVHRWELQKCPDFMRMRLYLWILKSSLRGRRLFNTVQGTEGWWHCLQALPHASSNPNKAIFIWTLGSAPSPYSLCRPRILSPTPCPRINCHIGAWGFSTLR